MIKIGQVINDEFIEKIRQKVEIIGYEEHMISKHFCKNYSADGDETGDFYESLRHITDTHSHVWQRDREYKDVTRHIESAIEYRLKEENFYGIPKNVDATQCGHHLHYEPTIVSESNQEAIEQCLRDSANDITWMISESWQVFLQTVNPCCWDNKPPQERYGEDWIEDPETRVILIEQQHLQYPISEDVIARCIEKGHTLQRSHGYITEYDTEGYQIIGAHDG